MNELIIIGCMNNYNELGMVRSFGVNHIKPIGILIGSENDWKHDWVRRSGYWKMVLYAKHVDEAIEILVRKFENEKEKPVVVTSMDIVMQKIDEQYEVLSQKFICSSFGKINNGINRYASKRIQYELTKSMGYNMLPTKVVELTDDRVTNFNREEIAFPVLLKPVQGGEGSKDDISIAKNKLELLKIYNKLKNKNYTRVLVQPYLDKRTEYVIQGAISPDNGFVSYTVLRNIRQWPNGYGVGSFSEYVVDLEIQDYVNGLMNNLIKKGYDGIIDIELFQDEQKNLYVNEFNWRSGGRNWISLDNEVYSSVWWYMNKIGCDVSTRKLINSRTGFVMYEINDFKHILNKSMGWKSWLNDVRKTTAFSAYFPKDIKPTIWIYSWVAKMILTGNVRKLI